MSGTARSSPGVVEAYLDGGVGAVLPCPAGDGIAGQPGLVMFLAAIDQLSEAV